MGPPWELQGKRILEETARNGARTEKEPGMCLFGGKMRLGGHSKSTKSQEGDTERRGEGKGSFLLGWWGEGILRFPRSTRPTREGEEELSPFLKENSRQGEKR